MIVWAYAIEFKIIPESMLGKQEDKNRSEQKCDFSNGCDEFVGWDD